MKTTKLLFVDNRLDNEGNQWKIEISLDDDCKNGHQDFSLTGTCWEKGKSCIDRNMKFGGACGDTIIKLFPEYEIFERLHICDFNGAPMYAVENGMYHAKRQGKDSLQNYLRLTELEAETLMQYLDEKLAFRFHLENMGIVARWKEEANEAIKKLEELTGKEFENVSTKSHYTPLTEEEHNEYKEKQLQGYFNADKIQERIEQKMQDKKRKQIEKLKLAAKTEIDSINTELNIKLAILDAGFSIDNFIYYKHKNEGKFNWLDSQDKLTKEDFDNLLTKIDKSKLPENINLHL
jgi:hypothetical protein